MQSRSAIAPLVLLAAAAASVATSYFEMPWPVVVAGPEVVLHPEMSTATVEVVFTGDARIRDAELAVDLTPGAGQWPGNPELTARLVQPETGEVLDSASGRGAFGLGAIWDCEEAPSCSRTFTLELEVTGGDEVELIWFTKLRWIQADDTGDADTDGDPVEATLSASVP